MLVCLKVPFTRGSQVSFPSLVSEHPQTPLTCLEGDGISYLWLISKLNFIHWAGQTSLPRHRHCPTTAVRGLRIQLVRTCHVYPQTSLLNIHECNHWSHFVGSAARYADNKWPASEDHEWNEWDRADHKTKDSSVSVIIWNLVWHHLQWQLVH